MRAVEKCTWEHQRKRNKKHGSAAKQMKLYLQQMINLDHDDDDE